MQEQDNIRIGINYYYCCKESNYQIYTIPKEDCDDIFLQNLKELYDGFYTEIFISEKFNFIWNKILDKEYEEGMEKYSECEYQFIYIICE